MTTIRAGTVLVTGKRSIVIVGAMTKGYVHAPAGRTVIGQIDVMIVSLATVIGWRLIIVAVVAGVLLGVTQMNDDPEMAIVGVIRLLPDFEMSVVGNLILTVTIFILDLPVFII